ncbi:LacI family transcriptional regulator [Bacillus sp. UMB0899]|nr:LacI family transcriptional regulator [Bacillus sp. UMB0899]
MNRENKNRVTLQQVAKHAGVSRATASLVVRNSSSISDKTKKKVLASIHELGYVYDRVAANLRSQRSSTVGIIITDIGNTFFSDLLKGINRTLEEHGYTVLLGTTYDSEDKQDRLLSTMLEHRVGGIILCPTSDTSKETMERLEKMDLPLVLAVRELIGLNTDYVGVNYRDGALMAVNHLIMKGHKKIAFLGGRKESSAWKQRLDGYLLAFQQAGLEVDESLFISSSPTREGGIAALHKLLLKGDTPSAVFCFNDLVALGVMYAIQNVGLTPGKDIAVVGFDNIPESTITNPPLTTISSFAHQIGSNAAQLLHKRIMDVNHNPERIILSPELVIRETTFEK